jgi:hypothetical protein
VDRVVDCRQLFAASLTAARVWGFGAAAVIALSMAAFIPIARAEPAISDNSFLVEEAYNQETRVVQHIATFVFAGPDREDLLASFTQEWPLGSQRHQGSFTITGADFSGDGPDGFGDLLLNYRFQLGGTGSWAIAPRASLIVPLEGEGDGPGGGALGAQVNLPLSVELGPHFVAHANAGYTWLSGVDRRLQSGEGVERDLSAVSFAASVIAPTDRVVQVLLETLVVDSEEIGDDGTIDRPTATTLSPGVRAAFEAGAVQLVPGLAFPITWVDEEKETGVFLYFSAEHAF